MEYSNNSFFNNLSIEELRLLGVITDEFYQTTDNHWKNLMEEIINEPKCRGDVRLMLFVFLMYNIILDRNETEKIISPFFDLPLDDMHLYCTVDNNREIDPEKLSSPCPPPEEGPLLWQSLLAKWRLHISR